MTLRRIIWIICLIVLIWGCVCPLPDISVYLIGDSTMANKKKEKFPETGWGQVFQDFFTDRVTVKNHAKNGRSSKSFIDEGLWQEVYDSLEKGDYVFIQFAHNDEKFTDPSRYTNPVTAYRQNLIRYIKESQSKGAIPVLLTPIVRRNYNEHGTLMDTHELYPLIVHDVGRELNVPVIDLQLLTEQLLLGLGETESKQLFNWLTPGENSNYPNGREDNTHLNVKGAYKVASLVADEISRQGIGLKVYLKQEGPENTNLSK
jgi:lysophospholipase L1-like esterase